ncbi:MAG: hypothetical protein ACRDBI_15580 [Shewanella sp.]
MTGNGGNIQVWYSLEDMDKRLIKMYLLSNMADIHLGDYSPWGAFQ